jgi:bifunctional non-homologous end joining protein LigD
MHRGALAHLGNRPLKLVRNTHGRVFFHTGGFQQIPEAVHALRIEKRNRREGIRLWVIALTDFSVSSTSTSVELHPAEGHRGPY